MINLLFNHHNWKTFKEHILWPDVNNCTLVLDLKWHGNKWIHRTYQEPNRNITQFTSSGKFKCSCYATPDTSGTVITPHEYYHTTWVLINASTTVWGIWMSLHAEGQIPLGSSLVGGKTVQGYFRLRRNESSGFILILIQPLLDGVGESICRVPTLCILKD